jgi:hypothetical protein
MIDKKTEITAPELNLFPIQGKNKVPGMPMQPGKPYSLKLIKTAARVKKMRTKIKIELLRFCTTKLNHEPRQNKHKLKSKLLCLILSL